MSASLGPRLRRPAPGGRRRIYPQERPAVPAQAGKAELKSTQSAMRGQKASP